MGESLRLSQTHMTAFHTAQNVQRPVGRLAPPGLQWPGPFVLKEQPPVIFGPGRIGLFKAQLLSPFTNCKGVVMEYKILIGLLCAMLAVVFAVGALALALGIGPIIFSLVATVVGGVGMISTAGLIGE